MGVNSLKKNYGLSDCEESSRSSWVRWGERIDGLTIKKPTKKKNKRYFASCPRRGGRKTDAGSQGAKNPSEKKGDASDLTAREKGKNSQILQAGVAECSWGEVKRN